MNHRAALQTIAEIRADDVTNHRELLATVIAVARTALDTKSAIGELAKQKRDRERALFAISVCERVFLRFETEPLHLRLAAYEEMVRLKNALDRPEALKAIYRRNERTR